MAIRKVNQYFFNLKAYFESKVHSKSLQYSKVALLNFFSLHSPWFSFNVSS